MLLLPVFAFAIAIGIVYFNQDKIVQTVLDELNENFAGTLRVKDSHISPFHNFPYISVDLEDISLFEGTDTSAAPLLEIEDAYVGFDLWNIISGKFQIKLIELKGGYLNLVQHADGNFNIVNAFSDPADKDTSATEDNLHLDLKKLRLIDLLISKRNETDSMHLELYVHNALASFKTEPQHLFTKLKGKLELDMMNGDDTLKFFRHKHLIIDAELDFDKEKELLKIPPSELMLEGVSFSAAGTVDLKNEADLNLAINGTKSDFDLLFAFLPEELAQYMQRYKNAGDLYFDASIKGKSINGNTPLITARFGCKNGYFENKEVKRSLSELAFSGEYTNGNSQNAQSSELKIMDLYAKPEQGIVQGNLVLRNFANPKVDLNVYTDFDLQFLAQFLQLEELRNLSGKVVLSVKFDELVDIQLPEASLSKLESGVDSKLEITNLGFTFPGFPKPVKNLNLKAVLKQGDVWLENLNFGIGKSDITLSGHIDNLPGIIRHTDDEIKADLKIESKRIDLKELTSFDTSRIKPIDEELSKLSLGLSFITTAREITEGKPLPKGELFIDDLFVKLKNYPHSLHDFHADILIGENELGIKDFTGEIDKTDFHFTGKINHYEMWFKPKPVGDARADFDMVSHQLVLHDLLTYKGENYLPEDYRNESLKELKLKGYANFHYNKGFEWLDVYLDKAEAKLNLHPLKLEKFQGNVHYQNHRITTKNLEGRLGASDFKVDLSYYIKADSTRKGAENYVFLKSTFLDIDQLTNFTPPPANKKVNHDSVFNVFSLPFSNTAIRLDITGLNYHRVKLKNIKGRLRLKENHYLYLDTIQMDLAGGHLDIDGYFNGSNPALIYFSPNMRFSNLDIDQLLIKFDNFGQDEMLNKNLHGLISGTLSGKLHVHTDLVPILEDSEIQVGLKVKKGKLVNFKPLLALSDFFKDKNLALVSFDTLENTITLKNGVLTIPNMNINSSLGFIEISGKQSLNAEMEYYIKIPWQLVTEVGSKLLFGGKKREEVDPDQEDAIVYRNNDKKVRFVNIKITGNPDNLKVSLGKEKRKS